MPLLRLTSALAVQEDDVISASFSGGVARIAYNDPETASVQNFQIPIDDLTKVGRGVCGITPVEIDYEEHDEEDEEEFDDGVITCLKDIAVFFAARASSVNLTKGVRRSGVVWTKLLITLPDGSVLKAEATEPGD